MSPAAQQWRVSVFDRSMVSSYASVLRRVLGQIPQQQLPIDIRADAAALLECCDNSQTHNTHRTSIYEKEVRMVRLLHSLLIADRLRADEDLKDMIQSIILYVFGPATAHTMVDDLEHLPVPSKFELSKARLKADVAFMLMMRCIDQHSGAAARYLMLDSSPQFHKDYEQIIEKRILEADLPELWEKTKRLDSMWEGAFEPATFRMEVVQELQKEEASIFQTISQKTLWHTLPPVLVGFGVCDLGRKIHAIPTLHAFGNLEQC